MYDILDMIYIFTLNPETGGIEERNVRDRKRERELRGGAVVTDAL